MSSWTSVGFTPQGTVTTSPSSTGTFPASTFDNVKDAAASTLSYLNPSPKDLFLAIPRLLARLGSFAFVVVPERIDHMFYYPYGRRVIAQATGNKTQSLGSVSPAISSAKPLPTMGPATAGAASRSASGSFFSHMRNFGGVFSYLTSKWAFACFTLVRTYH